jgi:hypothetical protein
MANGFSFGCSVYPGVCEDYRLVSKVFGENILDKRTVQWCADNGITVMRFMNTLGRLPGEPNYVSKDRDKFHRMTPAKKNEYMIENSLV